MFRPIRVRPQRTVTGRAVTQVFVRVFGGSLLAASDAGSVHCSLEGGGLCQRQSPRGLLPETHVVSVALGAVLGTRCRLWLRRFMAVAAGVVLGV
jgi:hypothetical protein